MDATATKLPDSLVFYAVVGVGLVIAADYAPKLVNGLLALILIGLLLRNYKPIQKWFNRGVNATK